MFSVEIHHKLTWVVCRKSVQWVTKTAQNITCTYLPIISDLGEASTQSQKNT